VYDSFCRSIYEHGAEAPPNLMLLGVHFSLLEAFLAIATIHIWLHD
jgi:hypothetical protein